MTFPLTLPIQGYDKELYPVIKNGIKEFICEIGEVTYPNIPREEVYKHYSRQYHKQYEALTLKIIKEIKDYVKTKTTNPSRGST